MKDELGEKLVTEISALISKTYSNLNDGNGKIKVKSNKEIVIKNSSFKIIDIL